MTEDNKDNKDNKDSSKSIIPPSLPSFSSFSISSISSYIPFGKVVTSFQQNIRQNIIALREAQESASKFIDPALKPSETFCKVVIEPLYYTSDSINKEYPYMSMLLRSQPGLVLGSTLALVNIPTLLIRKKSLKFMTVTSTLFVMSAIGIVNVKWLKDH